MILKEIFSGKTNSFTVSNSRKIHLSVIVFVVGVGLEVILVGGIVVILLCKKGKILFLGLFVCVCYIRINKNFFREQGVN